MIITEEARVLFERHGSSAGDVHRVCVHKYGVYPTSAVRAINEIAANGSTFSSSRELNMSTFAMARQIDSTERFRPVHDVVELQYRMFLLENSYPRRIVRCLDSIFQQESPLLW